MMKRLISTFLTVLLAICLLTGPALASVSATPNQKLAFRTGPSTSYVELYTLPQSTSIRAIEYESGNDVTWVLVEFVYQNSVCRAYTGLKRMSVNGYIPWADHLYWDACTTQSCDVWAAPSYSAGYRATLSKGSYVSILDYEGDFCFIEFYDGGTLSRGYVMDYALSLSGDDIWGGYDYYGGDSGGYYGGDTIESVPATPNQSLALRTGPNTKYVWLDTMPQSTSIRAIEYESGNDVTWVLVEYQANGSVVRGYTGLKRMTVHGYIPWASHLYETGYMTQAGTVLAAPTWQGAYRGRVYAGERVTLLRFEGDYAYIEFYDGDTLSRGYVESWMFAID